MVRVGPAGRAGPRAGRSLRAKRYGGTVVTHRSPPPETASDQERPGDHRALSRVVRPVPQRAPRDRRDGRRTSSTRSSSPPCATRRRASRSSTLEEREEMIERVARPPRQRRASRSSRSLVVDVAQEVGADFIVKGLRAVVRLRERDAAGPDEPGHLRACTRCSSRRRRRTRSSRRSSSGRSPASAATSARWCPTPVAKRLEGEVRHVSDSDDLTTAATRPRPARRPAVAAATAPEAEALLRRVADLDRRRPGRCRCRRR